MPRGTSRGTISAGRKPLVGAWWRASAYEIRSGFIRPCRGATFHEYNPWELFNDEKQKRGRSKSPYQSLISLVQKWIPDAKRELGASDGGLGLRDRELRLRTDRGFGQEVLEWCSQHGLLGILLASAHSVVLAPRWLPSLTITKDEPDGVLTPQTVRFTRTNGGWTGQTYGLFLGPHSLRQPYRSKLNGRPVPKDMWPSDFPQPHALLDSFVGVPGNWQEQPLSESWGLFFPDVPKRNRESYKYPRPGTIEFYESYAEPWTVFVAKANELLTVHEALLAAKLMWQCAKTSADKENFFEAFCKLSEILWRQGRRDAEAEVASWGFIRSRLDEQGCKVLFDLYLSLRQITSLVASVSPALVLDKEGLCQRWQMDSLVSALAMMMLQDLIGESIVRRCPVDGSLFSVRSAYWTQYCSKRCAEIAKKRRKRAKEASKSPR